MWAERFRTTAEGVAGRNSANTPCCVTLTWEKMHNSSLGGFTPPASHWHAHFCSRMITCSGGHRIDVAGTGVMFLNELAESVGLDFPGLQQNDSTIVLVQHSSFLSPSANIPTPCLFPGSQDPLLLLFLGTGSLWPLVCWAWWPCFFLMRDSRVHPLGTHENDLSRACGSQQGVWPSVRLSMSPHVAACPGVTPPSLPSPQALPLTLRPRQPRRAFLF